MNRRTVLLVIVPVHSFPLCIFSDKFNLSGDETTDDTQNAGMSPSSTCLLLPQSDGEKRQSYILYEGKDGDGESFIHVQRELFLSITRCMSFLYIISIFGVPYLLLVQLLKIKIMA